MSDRVEQLSKVDLFAGLKPEALELIAKVASQEIHALGTKIFQHGDAGDKLYLILEGKVRISRDVPGNGRRSARRARSGPGFRRNGVARRVAAFGADARVHERCRLLAIPKDGFDDLLFSTRTSPTRSSGASSACSLSRLRETNDKLTFLSVSGKF